MKKLIVPITVLFVFSLYAHSQNIEKHAPEGFDTLRLVLHMEKLILSAMLQKQSAQTAKL